MSRLFFALAVFCSLFATAMPTGDPVDTRVNDYLNKINHWRESEKDGATDSLANINSELEDYLLKALKNPKTLTSAFKQSSANGLDVQTSGDGNIRFYDWDTWTGGTMHIFTDIVQYRTPDGVAAATITDSTSEGDPGCFYTKVYTIKTTSSVVYMVTYGVVGSNRDKGEGIAAYAVQNNKLVNTPIFKTKTKQLDHIDYGYDFILIANKDGDRPEIHFSKDMQILYIPIVTGEGAFTNKFLTYKFDGTYFVFDKNAGE